jgi:hypothetical protein
MTENFIARFARSCLFRLRRRFFSPRSRWGLLLFGRPKSSGKKRACSGLRPCQRYRLSLGSARESRRISQDVLIVERTREMKVISFPRERRHQSGSPLYKERFARDLCDIDVMGLSPTASRASFRQRSMHRHARTRRVRACWAHRSSQIATGSKQYSLFIDFSKPQNYQHHKIEATCLSILSRTLHLYVCFF